MKKQFIVLMLIMAMALLTSCNVLRQNNCIIDDDGTLIVNNSKYFYSKDSVWKPIETDYSKVGLLKDKEGNIATDNSGKQLFVYGYDMTSLVVVVKTGDIGAIEKMYYSCKLKWPEFKPEDTDRIELEINANTVVIDDENTIAKVFEKMREKTEDRPADIENIGQATFINNKLYNDSIVYKLNLLEGEHGLYCSEKYQYGTYYFELPDCVYSLYNN